MPVMDIQQALVRRKAIQDAMTSLMVEGVDYGKIPGADRPMLFEPGAEKLLNLFGLTPQFAFLEKEEDWSGERHAGEPFFYYQIHCRVFRGDFLIGEGMGSCTSWESKYRWRQAERTCPACHKENIRKSKDRDEWYCWRKVGGCGATFALDDPQITSQQTGRKPNPDIFDCVNTVLKMALKRAKISGTKNATSASEFFSQDMEDFTPPEEVIDTGGYRPGSSAAAYVAKQKVEGRQPLQRKGPWKTMLDLAEAFKGMRERVGESVWRAELERYGWRNFQDIRNAIDNRTPGAPEKAADLYFHLEAIANANKEVA
jgi:hypothetical protein